MTTPSTIPSGTTNTSRTKNQTPADAASQQLVTNTQDFLKLLTTQLQNQDPTNPLNTDQMTQQIAQLSQVEQQIGTNKNLQQLMALYAQTQTSNAVSYIGKLVESEGNQTVLTGSNSVIVYNLDSEASKAQVTIKDAQGNTVYSDSGTTLAGRNQLIWDGTKTDGSKAPDGIYTVSISATGVDGKAINSTTTSAGMVTALQSQDGTNTLMLGTLAVTLDKVKAVRNMPVAATQTTGTGA